jgi:hypothetical protein
MACSRMATCISSMKTPSTPGSAKSSSVVSSVSDATGRSPRAARAASAAQRIVPPTQKPSAFTFFCPVISRTTSMVSKTPSCR